MSAPSVSSDGVTTTIILIRNGKEVEHVFGDHNIAVCAARPEDLSKWELDQIKGSPSADKIFYYICATPNDVGAPFFLRLENKEEALAVKQELEAALDFSPIDM
jgi:hypothetical protein